MKPQFARLTALALALLYIGVPAGAADCSGWCASLVDRATDLPLGPLRADYEVDVYGAAAQGVLLHEFRNDSAAKLKFELRLEAPAGLRPTRIAYEKGGETVELRGGDRSKPKGREARPGPEATPEGPMQIELEPGQSVTVRSSFRLQLPVEKGRLVLVLPAIGGTSGEGREAGVELAHGYRIVVHHDQPLGLAESTTHDIFADFRNDRSVIELASGDAYSPREFRVEFAIGREDDATLVGHVGREHDGVREVLAVLTPPPKPRQGSARPKQLLFVLDTSGSMGREQKLEQARQALYAALARVTTADTFNVVEFDGDFSIMAPEPVRASEESLAQARSWLGAQRPGGATQLLPALAAAIEQPEDPQRHEMIVVMTDGNVQDPQQVEQLLQQNLGQGRLFVVGIGDDMKRENILRFAEFGRGTAVFADDAKALEASLARLFDAIGEPLIWDLEIDWGGADVREMEPTRVPDLYAGRPVTVRAMVRGKLPDSIALRGETMEGERTFTTPLQVPENAGSR